MNANDVLFICLIITEIFNVIIIRQLVSDIEDIKKK